MFEWLILALVAAAMWGLVNVVDKIIVEKHIRNPLIYLVFSGVYGLIPAIFMIGITGLQPTSLIIIILSMLTGFILIAYTYLYFKALQYSDTAVVVSLLQMIPIFSLIWGFIFFNEIFNIVTYIGIFLVLFGVTIISLPHNKEKHSSGTKWNMLISRAMLIMIPSTFLASVGYAIQNHVVEFTDSPTIFFWGRIGALLTVGVLLFNKNIRYDVLNTLKNVDTKINFAIIVNEIISILAVFIVIFAYSIGPLSLIATTLSVQPFFAMVYVMLINYTLKNIIPDSTNRNIFYKRFSCIFMITIGIYLISM